MNIVCDQDKGPTEAGGASTHSGDSEVGENTTVSSVASVAEEASGMPYAHAECKDEAEHNVFGRDQGKTKSVDDALMDIEGARSISEVLDATSQICSQLSGRQVAAALYQIAKCFESEPQTPASCTLPCDPRYGALVTRLSETAGLPDIPRLMMRSLWALGKVGACGPDVDSIVSYLATVGAHCFKDSTTQDLSNALWGLAKLASAPDGVASRGDHGCRLAGKARRDAMGFARLLVSENSRRVESLSDQCLSNCLWALAKLDLRGSTESFARACVVKLRSRPPSSIRPQALANSLWAVARLQLDHAVAVPFCTDVACRALASPGALGAFLSHELSMALWAVAKIARSPLARGTGSGSAGGGSGGSRGRLHAEIVALADGVGTEACSRIREFSPQSLSNIAWALGSMDLTQREASRKFLVFAAEVSAPELHSYSPQAIANLCWAFSKLGSSSAVARFGACAACQASALERTWDFTWQDHASIISALARLGLGGKPEVRALAVWLVGRTSGQCQEVGTQALLNIATALVRLGVTAEEMQFFAWEIAEVFSVRTAHLNDVDMRQWWQVQRHCNLPGMCGRPLSGWR